MTDLPGIVRSGLLAALMLMATAAASRAGMDVSLDREYRNLLGAQRRVEALPALREVDDLKRQIAGLQERFETAASGDPGQSAVERASLRKQIETLQRRLDDLATLAKTNAPFDGPGSQVGGAGSARFFPGVRHRIAAFTFDDPHGTGLGDPISFLLAKKMLFSTRVTSFAIVNYHQSVDRVESGGAAYFDRVDAITRDQDFMLAAWGRLSATGDGMRVDAFLQVPTDPEATPYLRRVRLPEAMGSGVLTVRLKPDRVALLSLTVGPEEAAALHRAAEDVAALRAEPVVGAAVVGRLGAAGSLRDNRAYRIVDSRPGWVRLQFADGVGGWTSVDAFCRAKCRQLMAAAIFANDFVALASGQTPRDPPEPVSGEARAMAQQLAAMNALADDPRQAVAIAEPWVFGKYGEPPPGGAGFANLLAVARLSAALERAAASEPVFDRVRLDRALVERIADDLARASVADPADVDVLENLAVLFGYLGDERRQRLARLIAADMRKR